VTRRYRFDSPGTCSPTATSSPRSRATRPRSRPSPPTPGSPRRWPPTPRTATRSSLVHQPRRRAGQTPRRLPRSR